MQEPYTAQQECEMHDFHSFYNYLIRISSLTNPKHGNIFVREKLLHNMHTSYAPQVLKKELAGQKQSRVNTSILP